MSKSEARGAKPAAPAQVALRLEGVTHAFDGVPVVEDVDLTIAPKELMCLVGPSGCGKTTILRIAAGLEELQRGRVTIYGQLVANGGVHVPPEEREVGLVFQDFALFPHLTVEDNAGFGLVGLGATARRARARDVLAQVGMAGFAQSYPHVLSGGEQQRVALARALAPKPRLMLLDEPFSGLDTRLREQIRDETLHVLKSGGATTLLVTHDSEEAMFMGDRIAVMREGRIAQVGTPAELYCCPACAFVAGFFSEVNRLEAVVADGKVLTPFGALAAPGLGSGERAQILIRPEALQVAPAEGGVLAQNGPYQEAIRATGRVITARMLGRTSLVHMGVVDADGRQLHLHARVPGRFLPAEGALVDVALDQSMAFVFPADMD
jgi:iron(III) transport system ATP-binding protein